METFTIHAAKTHLSRLLERVRSGEEITIAKGKDPVAKLVPINTPKKGRRFGILKGQGRVDYAFFDKLPENEKKGWGE